MPRCAEGNLQYNKAVLGHAVYPLSDMHTESEDNGSMCTESTTGSIKRFCLHAGALNPVSSFFIPVVVSLHLPPTKSTVFLNHQERKVRSRVDPKVLVSKL